MKMQIAQRLAQMNPVSRYCLYASLSLLSFLLISSLLAEQVTDSWQVQRQQMVDEIRQDVVRTQPFTGLGALDRQVLEVMENIPRHEFVPSMVEIFAYLNRPLPIGAKQTISQPFIVALMTHVIAPQASDTVLEIGTGSGYQAAVLSKLVNQVHSIEIIPELAETAKFHLAQAGYDNVTVILGDGFDGYPSAAPYDAIIVTAAIEDVPKPLLTQLKPGGRMIIPLGQTEGVQELTLVSKDAQGQITRKSILPVRFVPFTGDKGQAVSNQNPAKL